MQTQKIHFSDFYTLVSLSVCSSWVYHFMIALMKLIVRNSTFFSWMIVKIVLTVPFCLTPNFKCICIFFIVKCNTFVWNGLWAVILHTRVNLNSNVMKFTSFTILYKPWHLLWKWYSHQLTNWYHLLVTRVIAHPPVYTADCSQRRMVKTALSVTYAFPASGSPRKIQTAKWEYSVLKSWTEFSVSKKCSLIFKYPFSWSCKRYSLSALNI